MPKRPFVLSVLLIASSVAALATTYVRKPTLDDLAQSWLGGTPKGILEYARLELRPDGTGLFVLQELPHHEPYAYEVLATELDGYEVTFALRPAESRAEPIYLKGHATPGDLDLEVGGLRLNWKRELFLETETKVRGRIDAVSDHAKRFTNLKSPSGAG